MSEASSRNEAARLEALRSYQVLDSLPEAAFDDLTLLAAHVCGVPTAMVSLIDENRQWFKSRVGMPATETARDIAFCDHAIRRPREVLEVPDALADPRFASSPLVTEAPHIRFYAGAPLVTAEGHALGALCVMDTIPRTLSVDQLAALQALSRRAVAQLELRRHTRELATREQEAARLLGSAEKARRALLSVLEDEKLAARNLRESEERFRQMAESIDEVFWMSDVEKAHIIYVSPAYAEIWGRRCEELYTNSHAWLESLHPEDRARVQAAFPRQAAGDYDETYRIVRPDGSQRWIRDRAFPVKAADGHVRRVVGVAEDITERKKLEEQFLHAQRMEAIGTLASGVAHDLNNILAPILMVAGILKTRPGNTAKDIELLELVERSGQRGAGIIGQLLTFSRSTPGERGPVQLRHLVRDMAGIMRETFPRNITIQESAGADLWPIEADPTRIHQVVMNLCVNARDAMPDGGTLSIAVRNVPAEELDRLGLTSSMRRGPAVRLQVQDSGTGIPPEIINRIFEPFFTTKGVGKGTGLGLSTVIGIVKSHGGVVKVESQPGQGSSFLIYLPAAATGSAAGLRDPQLSVPRGEGELVLVVDDESPIRKVTSTLLEKHGYRVVVAGSGEEAVRLFVQHHDSVRLVLTDIMMPGMDGLALIRALRNLRPSLPIVATSGLDQAHNRAELAGLGIRRILTKPTTPTDLLAAVAEEIAG